MTRGGIIVKYNIEKYCIHCICMFILILGAVSPPPRSPTGKRSLPTRRGGQWASTVGGVMGDK